MFTRLAALAVVSAAVGCSTAEVAWKNAMRAGGRSGPRVSGVNAYHEQGQDAQIRGERERAQAAEEAAESAQADELPGCGKDTDCKGDRICVDRECVFPPGSPWASDSPGSETTAPADPDVDPGSDAVEPENATLPPEDGDGPRLAYVGRWRLDAVVCRDEKLELPYLVARMILTADTATVTESVAGCSATLRDAPVVPATGGFVEVDFTRAQTVECRPEGCSMPALSPGGGPPAECPDAYRSGAPRYRNVAGSDTGLFADWGECEVFWIREGG